MQNALTLSFIVLPYVSLMEIVACFCYPFGCPAHKFCCSNPEEAIKWKRNLKQMLLSQRRSLNKCNQKKGGWKCILLERVGYHDLYLSYDENQLCHVNELAPPALHPHQMGLILFFSKQK